MGAGMRVYRLSRRGLFSHHLLKHRHAANQVPNSSQSQNDHVVFHYDASSYEAQRIITQDLTRPINVAKQVDHDKEQLQVREVTEPVWNKSPTHPEISTRMIKSNSEQSLHGLTRRRSIVQTPGVATRTEKSPVPVLPSDLVANLQRTLPPTPNVTLQTSPESTTPEQASLLSADSDADVDTRSDVETWADTNIHVSSVERVETPVRPTTNSSEV